MPIESRENLYYIYQDSILFNDNYSNTLFENTPTAPSEENTPDLLLDCTDLFDFVSDSSNYTRMTQQQESAAGPSKASHGTPSVPAVTFDFDFAPTFKLPSANTNT
ncbi:UNVERIFIED_CONTAM: hypothetical protein HDU68_006146, partial [Siphonaria sp. JEL0065]